MGVYVKGRFAYLADAIRVSGDKPYSYMPKGDKALKVIDIEDPTHPQLIESQMSPGDSQTATPVGELARVVNLHRMVYEITPQTAPIPALIQMHVIAGGLFGFDMVGSFAYSYWDGGLAIYDVRDPGSPKKISVFKTGSGIWDVRVAGKHAYVMDSHASIHVLDVSDPAKPLELAQFKCTGYVSRWIALQPLITNVTGTNLSTAPKLPAPKLAPIDTEPPQLVNERRLPDGSFEFTLVGVANGNYIIQYTVDWSGWTSLSTNSLPANGHATIADPHAAEATQRYYRAVKQ